MPKSASNKRSFIIVGVLVVIMTIVMGLLLNAVLPMPKAAATQAATVDWLFSVHMWLIAFLFSLVLVFMVYSIVVYRRRKGDDSDGEHFEGNTVLEIVWTVVPLIAVVVFSYIGVQTLFAVTRTPADEVVIKVEAFQWGWNFTYPNGKTSSNEVVVPVDKNLKLEMNAKDVIHNFWVPEWRLKQDIVPGMTTTIHFTPDRQGEYTLMCNLLCGLSHTLMLAKVKVVPEAEFTAYLQGQPAAMESQQTASR